MLDEHLGANLLEAEPAVEPHPVLVAEEQREVGAQGGGLVERGLKHLQREALTAVVPDHDHADQPDHRKAPASGLDLGHEQAR